MPASDGLRTYSAPPLSITLRRPIESNVRSKLDLTLLTPPIEPPLSPAEREIVKGYGGWTNFLFSYGLKPWNDEDAEEGLLILKGLAQVDENDVVYVDDKSESKQ